VVAGGGLVYAWRQGWLTEAHFAALRSCEADLAPSVATGPSPPGAPALRLVTVAEGLERPTTVTFHPDPALDLAYVAEQAGTVRAIRDDQLAGPPLLDLVGRVSTEFDQGLLGLAVESDGSHLYGYFTGDEGDDTLAAWDLDASGRPDPASEVVVLVQEDPAPYHNGGALVFGPDGALYLTMGDGGLLGDPEDNGQRPDSLLGKILRFDVGQGPEAASPETFARGTRNPYRMAFDRANGDLWVADVGHNCIEEINRIPAGVEDANLGWNRREGNRPFVGDEPDDHLPPVYWYTHAEGCAVIGGARYRGAAIPSLQGAYVFADYCAGHLRALTVDMGEVTGATDLDVPVPLVTGITEDLDGELYITVQGQLARLEPARSPGG
jgi:glucose/arabinose dehydrogenase